MADYNLSDIRAAVGEGGEDGWGGGSWMPIALLALTTQLLGNDHGKPTEQPAQSNDPNRSGGSAIFEVNRSATVFKILI